MCCVPYLVKYALLALIFLIIIPPLLLLLYPLVFKCLGLCKQSESKFSTFLWRLMPIQILDAFQSSFKDRYRFFAGLYFLYRAIILAAYAYSGTVFGFYSAIQLLVILVLTFHAVIQPYKSRKHNILFFISKYIHCCCSVVKFAECKKNLG